MFLGKFVVVYFDDIVIYSMSQDDHLHHVLETLRKASLYANMKKCVFGMDHVMFLGFKINQHGVHVDQEKVMAIKDWPPPKNVSELRSFHGLASFYRRFVPNLSTIAAPLNELVKKGVVYKWGKDQEKGFETLKQKLINAPLLASLTSPKPLRLSVMYRMWVLGTCFSKRDTP